MKKYIGALTGLLFFVGLLLVASNLNSADPETEFITYNDYQNSYIRLPSMNITADTLRNWTGAYWNYTQYNRTWVFVRNVSVEMYENSSAAGLFANLNITYDAYGNDTSYNYSNAYDSYNIAIVRLPGQKFAQYTTVNTYSRVQGVEEFLRLYGIYVALPQLTSSNSSSSRNSTYNYTNSTYNYTNTTIYHRSNSSYSYPSYNASYNSSYNTSYNYSNSSYNYPRYNYSNSTSNYSRYNYSNSTYNYTNYTNSSSNTSRGYFPDPIYGRSNLTVQLPSRNISFGSNMSIYVYNATFIGNTTRNGDFRGRIYAKFNANAMLSSGWYSYFQSLYDERVVYDVISDYSTTLYYNYSLLNNSNALQELLISYRYNVSTQAIYEAINTTNTTSNKTIPSYGQSLPSSYLTGYNLSYWSNSSWSNFSNYTFFDYRVIVNNATFVGYTDKWNANGTIYLRFDAYGNDSTTPPYNQGQTWEDDVNATIQFSNNWVYSINFNRPLKIYKSDISNFLRAWVVNVVNPYLLSNSSSNTTGIVFPEMNMTGYYLNNVLPGWYSNYTVAGYFVSVYNISSSLQKSNNDVSGWVNLAFVAFGNDTYDTNCTYSWYSRCNQTIVYSNASIYVYGVQSNSTPYFSQDYYTRVNASDIQNFLRAYYIGVIVPNITNYYNLTNSTTNQTIYLPNYYNDTQINIDCSKVSYWYCSGANPQSSLFFLGAIANNMSFTVNGQGYGYFNGNMRIPYMANLINFTSTYEGKETIVDNLQGNATLYLSGQVSPQGNNSYYISLNSYSYASTVYDRNYFVQNAVQQLFQDRYYYGLQYFINSYASNGTNSTRYRNY